MPVELIYHCDGPDCGAHVKTQKRFAPAGFLTVANEFTPTVYFCGWDCALRYGATLSPSEYFNADGDPIDRPTLEGGERG